VDRMVPPLSPHAALCCKAAIALGYALSLRPQEYLSTSQSVDPWKRAHSSLCFFWFPNDDIPYNVCYPASYPPRQRPRHFTLFLDFNKNHTTGDAGPRSISRAPPESPVCCLSILFDFLTLYPPLPESALLSGFQPHIHVSTIRDIFRATALSL
jgi:hypothetical protein